jgi:hypothetical protein
MKKTAVPAKASVPGARRTPAGPAAALGGENRCETPTWPNSGHDCVVGSRVKTGHIK